ncbi:MAG: hypothetical protein WDO14_02110 [Bacteroidota bacterium]
MKTFRYTIILATVFLLGSCKDLLDTEPNDRISTDIFWRTQTDALYGTNAVYTFLNETQTAGNQASHFMSWDGMTDIGYTHQHNRRSRLYSRDNSIRSTAAFTLTSRPSMLAFVLRIHSWTTSVMFRMRMLQ